MKKFKIPYLNLLPMLLIAFLLFKLVNNTELSFGGVFKTLYGCVAYFVSGFVVAYLLNPALSFFEKLILSQKDSQKARKLKRAGVIAFLYLLLIGVVTVFVVAIIPTIREGVAELMLNLPRYTESVERWLESLMGSGDPRISVTIRDWAEDGVQLLYNLLNKLDLSSMGDALTAGVSSVVTALIRFGFGFIISVYYLYSKERLILGIKKLCYAILGKDLAEKTFATGQKINTIFLNFIVSKLLQSLVMFIVGLLVLVPLNIPLAPLVALFIAVTNMIPYFGPYIGAVPSILLVLFFDPVKAFWILVYAVGVQILDNAVIGPKVMSDQVGISPILVIAGVTLGGTFGGVLGMFIGVPIVAVIKLVFYDPYIEKKLRERDIEVR